MTGAADFRTIKALVLDHVHRCGGHVNYDALTAEVKRRFPASKWKKTHWAWYRHQILHGRFRELFSEDERSALSQGTSRRSTPAVPPAPPAREEGEALLRGPQAKDPEVKRIGDAILDHIRFVFSLAAGGDDDKRFKLNRWVFSRLLQDEIRVKRPIKKALWDRGMRTCQACGERFVSIKGVEIHRKDETAGYSAENCELLCRECHQELD